MSRRRQRQEERRIEALVKGIGGIILLIALGIGGITHFVPVLMTLIFGLLGLVIVVGLGYIGYRFYKTKTDEDARFSQSISSPIRNVTPSHYSSTPSAPSAPVRVEPVWNKARIEEALGEIDWYQFEKFCAALLRSEGYQVERKGGAQPDGGVDLVATKNGESTLVQVQALAHMDGSGKGHP